MVHVANKLEQALASHQAGQLDQAEQLYREIVRLDPCHADALHLLGVAANQRRRHADAVDYIQRALEQMPGFAGAHFNLGIAYDALDQSAEAVESYREAVRIDGQFADGYNNLGRALARLKRFEEAADTYRQALALRPDSFEMHYNLGNTLYELGRREEAVASFENALAQNDSIAAIHNNLGIVLKDLGRYEEAAACFERATALEPRFGEAHNNLGTTREILGAEESSLESFRTAVALCPDRADMHYNLATAFQQFNRYAEAKTHFERSLALKPEFALANSNLAVLLQTEGKLAEAAEHFRLALKNGPSARRQIQLATLLAPVYESSAQLDDCRQRLSEDINRLVDQGLTLDPAVETIPTQFYLAYQGLHDRRLLERFNKLYRSSHRFRDTNLTRRNRGVGRIRVGFISNYFTDHTIGHLNRGLIAKLSRERFHVTTLTPVTHRNEMAQQIRDSADAHVELSKDVGEARNRIEAQELDVLFYTDIGMDSVTSALAYSRLAPVQCTTWGHPCTSGIETIDYYLSSKLIEPDDGDAHYSERLIQLQSLPTYYFRPEVEPASRDCFELNERTHIYLCPQSLFKFHPDFDAVLAGILAADPEGEIVLIDAPHSNWINILRRRFERNIPSGHTRIRFLPRQGYRSFLGLMSVADVMLDPLHFGGGNTSYQALALGVPVVTLPGPFMRGRVTYGCYTKMGMTECVASNAEDYIRRAVRLATDKSHRRHARNKILESNNVLFEDDGALTEIERFLAEAVDNIADGAQTI